MHRTALPVLAAAALMVAAPAAVAQTTLPGGAIDVEIYNPTDGTNLICAAPGDTLWAGLYVRPASGAGSTMTCSLLCGSASGGPGSLAVAAVDVGFSASHLAYFRTDVNPDPAFAAADGLVQEQNLADGRVGWALAGDWTPDGSTGGSLADPCAMLKLADPGWVARIGFNVLEAGQSQLAIGAPPASPLSFADVCGSPAYTTANGGVDEVVPAAVSTECPSVSGIIFRNGVDTGDTSVWSESVG